ncbi:TPA: hypothetical protein ACTA6G_005198 [Escherichia coli]
MIKMINCTASNCGVGYVFGKGVDAELINSHARACKIGFVQAGNEKEWSILLEKLLTKKADFESLLTVCETVNSEDKKTSYPSPIYLNIYLILQMLQLFIPFSRG